MKKVVCYKKVMQPFSLQNCAEYLQKKFNLSVTPGRKTIRNINLKKEKQLEIEILKKKVLRNCLAQNPELENALIMSINNQGSYIFEIGNQFEDETKQLNAEKELLNLLERVELNTSYPIMGIEEYFFIENNENTGEHLFYENILSLCQPITNEIKKLNTNEIALSFITL